MENRKHKYVPIYLLLAAFCLLSALSFAARKADSSTIPENIGRKLDAAEQAEVIARNSPLAGYAELSPNATFPRTGRISKITVHHMGGNISLSRLGEVFADPSRQASANYGIDTDGNIAIYVEECNRAWSSSSPENDDMAVTIEVANDEAGGRWHVSDESYDALTELCIDICRRNGMNELVWTGDEKGSLTIHKFFKDDTECPGTYLESRMPDLAEAVTKSLSQR